MRRVLVSQMSSELEVGQVTDASKPSDRVAPKPREVQWRFQMEGRGLSKKRQQNMLQVEMVCLRCFGDHIEQVIDRANLIEIVRGHVKLCEDVLRRAVVHDPSIRGVGIIDVLEQTHYRNERHDMPVDPSQQLLSSSIVSAIRALMRSASKLAISSDTASSSTVSPRRTNCKRRVGCSSFSEFCSEVGDTDRSISDFVIVIF